MQSFEREHIDKLRACLPECMVLLKRDGAFPLDGPCRIAAFGAGVRDTVKGGTGSGEVNSRYFVSIEEGLKAAGFEISNPEWPDRYAAYLKQAKAEFKADIKRKAKAQKVNVIAASMGAVLKQPDYQIELDLEADAALYVVSRLSGEGNDRLPEKGDFELTDSEVRDILALDTAYDKFMLVINAGGPVDLSPVAEVGNILVMSQLGVEGGAALADVLLGKSYPSGKLATTWSAYEDYCSIGDFAERDDARYREGIYVGYRYFDAVGKKPLFPFGFGLGYTDFAVEGLACEARGPVLCVSADLVNTGCSAGKETLQVYVSCPSGKLAREPKVLVGFAKTRELQAGQSERVSVSFDVRDLAGFDSETASYLLEPGAYVLYAGTSSADVEPFVYFELADAFVVRQVRNLFGEPDFEDARFDCAGSCNLAPANPNGSNDANLLDEEHENGALTFSDLPRVEVDLSGLVPEVPTYDFADGRIGVEDICPGSVELLGQLTNEELAYLNVGAFDPKGGMLSVIGNASQSVAGAAGESSSVLAERGVRPLVMADGPAGLRLSRQFYVDDKGVHSVGLSIPESVLDVLPAPVKWFMMRPPRLKKGVVMQEQFTTALPIATAIAQSFNLEFARMCGDIVGVEMEVFGVDLWLAPALNIHRNVLCGRNFEYYSEDPLLSGKFAAAVTRGVQAHEGKGVTLKHYAANNQETNRYANNSVVSERALREIYLRGFEICVREASPRAVMTSYNLINGVHTSEMRDLTVALRDEFGFAGVVMTDWIIGGDFLTGKTKYPAPDPAKVAAAGCSLFMPGSKDDYNKLLQGLAAGTVSREDLERNAAYLLREL